MGPSEVPFQRLRLLRVDLRTDQFPDRVLRMSRAGKQQVVDVNREQLLFRGVPERTLMLRDLDEAKSEQSVCKVAFPMPPCPRVTVESLV